MCDLLLNCPFQSVIDVGEGTLVLCAFNVEAFGTGYCWASDLDDN